MKTWSRTLINTTKQQIKAELDLHLEQVGRANRLKVCLEQIDNLDNTIDSDLLLKRFVYVMSALVHHQKWGGLQKNQIQNLGELGSAILKIAEIKPVKTQASFLFGELHSILSAVHFKRSEFLDALWEHQLGDHLSTKDSGLDAARNLDMGINALRLGNSHLALKFLETALEISDDCILAQKVQLQRVRGLRLSGSLEEALELISQSKISVNDERYQVEFEWEEMYCRIAIDQDPSPLLLLTQRGGTHYHPSYLLECFMILRSLPKKQWQGRFPKLASVNRHKEISLRDYRQLHDICLAVENAYESDIPFHHRLSKLKPCLSKIRELRTIDKELLAWLSITRWLYRSRYMAMAAVTWSEYQSLSKKLSQGKSGDVLGMAKDLEEIDFCEKIK
ncbi:MAG: hypothetical protein HRU19_23425 [Pseudobacteriovorax sp.]|nr:hypothetical protein [Pseudobacteriovorax sp.]